MKRTITTKQVNDTIHNIRYGCADIYDFYTVWAAFTEPKYRQLFENIRDKSISFWPNFKRLAKQCK